MTFKAPDSLAEQIAHHLAERIIRGEYYNAGEKINNNEPEKAPAEGDDNVNAGNA